MQSGHGVNASIVVTSGFVVAVSYRIVGRLESAVQIKYELCSLFTHVAIELH